MHTHKNAPSDPEVLEALAEARFRIALDPHTPADESIAQLHECLQLDAINPRYAYHLARLYFLHYELDVAQRWILRACKQCPTSHRIWAHVSLLQFEMNARYYGDERYEPDALRKRAERIAEAVQSGSDSLEPAWLSFTPPESRAVAEQRERQGLATAETNSDQGMPEFIPSNGHGRVDRPKTCRWTGVYDVLIEQMLEGSPSQRMADRLIPLFETVAELSLGRRGGLGAFAILACQWIVRGYPVATVRRLMAEHGLDTHPSRSMRLLALVCDICDAPEVAVPSMLNEALSHGAIPPVLTALLHQKLLLWRPHEYRNARAFLTGQRVLAQARTQSARSAEEQQALTEAVNDSVSKLKQALASLEAAAPKAPQDVRRSKSKHGTSLEDAMHTFDRVESEALRLNALRETAFAYLKESMGQHAGPAPDSPDLAQMRRDAQFFPGVIDALVAAAERLLERLKPLADVVVNLDSSLLPQDFTTRRESCEKSLTAGLNLGNFRKLLRRVETSLAKHATTESSGEIEDEPSGELLRIAQDIGALGQFEVASAPATHRPIEMLADLEHAANRLEEARADLFRFLTETLTISADAADSTDMWKRLIADRMAFAATMDLLPRVGEQGVAALENLVEVLGSAPPEDRPDDFEGRRDRCDKQFKSVLSLGSFHKGLKRIDKKIAAAGQTVGEAPGDESEALVLLRERVLDISSTIDPTDSRSPDPATPQVRDEPAPQGPSAPRENGAGQGPSQSETGADRLASLLRDTRAKLRARFEQDLATFAVYPPWALMLPALHSLYFSLRARQANTWYRLAEPIRARGIWDTMLEDDRVVPDVYKNIAVADMDDRLGQRALSSWKRYAESLYLHDAVLGNLRAHAHDRVTLHRAFARAYGTPILFKSSSAEKNTRDEDDAAIAFMSCASRVEHFIDHVFLEFLNGQFSNQSASIVLGVNRSDTDERRDEALQRMKTFVDTAVAKLPTRIRKVTHDAFFERLHAARQDTRSDSRRRIAADSTYNDEVDTHVKMLSHVCLLRLQVFMCVKNTRFVSRMTSVDFITHFTRLDDIPYDITPGFAATAAAAASIDEESMRRLMELMPDHLVQNLLAYLLDEADDPAERSQRAQQYRRLAGNWAYHPAFAKYLPVLDAPLPFLSERILKELEHGKLSETSLDTLRSLATRYPGMTGLSRLLANSLINQGNLPEAIDLLEKTAQAAFSTDGFRQSSILALSLKTKRYFDNEQYMEAVAVARELVDFDDRTPGFAIQFINIVSAAAQHTQSKFEDADVTDTVNQWLGRARKVLAEWEATETEPEPPFTAGDLESVEALRDRAAVDIVFLAAGGASGKADWHALLRDMNDIILVYPGRVRAYVYRMQAYFMLIAAAFQNGEAANMRTRIREWANAGLADARLVLDRSKERDERESAEHIISQLNTALERI